MADKKITQLNPQPVATFIASATDLLAIVDVGASETKRITIQNLMGTPGPIGSLTTASTGTFTAMQLTGGGGPYPQVDEISTDVNLGTADDVLPTQNAVKSYVDNQISAVAAAIVNPVHVSSDSTAVVGDVIFVDTTGSDVNIEMIEVPKGRITVIKISPDANIVTVTPRNGTINGDPYMVIETQWETYTFVTDTNNFYIV
jgi:hypothetical protein